MNLDEQETSVGLWLGFKSAETELKSDDASDTADDGKVNANIHSVFDGSIKYSLSASKNDEKIDESAYRLVLKTLDTEVEGALATSAFLFSKNYKLTQSGYLGMTRGAMVRNEKAPLKAEICVASNDEDGKILETADGKEACQEKTFSINTNAYGMYKIALADHLTCGLNRIGDLYCWGTAPNILGLRSLQPLDIGSDISKQETKAVSDGCVPRVVEGQLIWDCGGLSGAQIVSTPTIFESFGPAPEISDLALIGTSGNPDQPVIALHINGDLVEYPLQLVPVMQDEDEDADEELHYTYTFAPFLTQDLFETTFFAGAYAASTDSIANLYDMTYLPNVRSFAYSSDAALVVRGGTEDDETELLMVAKGPAQYGYEGYIAEDQSVSMLTTKSARVYTGGSYSCVDSFVDNFEKTKGLNCFGTIGWTDDDESYISTDTGNSPIHSIMFSGTSGTAYSNIGEAASAQIPQDNLAVVPQKVSISDFFACAVTASTHAAYCWGLNVLPGEENSEGQAGLLGIGSADAQKVFQTPQRLEKFKDTKVYDIAVSHDHACAVATEDQKLFCWGSKVLTPIFGGDDENAPVYDKLGLGGSADFTGEPTEVEGLKDIDSVFVGKFRTCAIDNGGKAFCFGLNENGELGTGDTSSAVKPVEVKYEPVKYVRCEVSGNQEDFNPEASLSAANWAGIEVCYTSDDEDGAVAVR